MVVPILESWTANDSEGVEVTSLSLTKPSGVQNGDLLLIIACSDDATSLHSFLDITDWNRFGSFGDSSSDTEIALYWKIANGTEPSTTSITANSLDEMCGWYLRISGIDTTTPINAIGTGQIVDSNSSHTINSITTTAAECLGFYVLAFDGADGIPFSVSGTGWSETDEQSSGTSTGVGACFGTKDITNIGSSGDAIVTSSVADGSTSVQFAIAPQGEAPVTPDTNAIFFGGGF